MKNQQSYPILFFKIFQNISQKSRNSIILILGTICLSACLDLIVLTTTLVFISSLTGDFDQLKGSYIYSLIQDLNPKIVYIRVCVMFIVVMFLSSLLKTIFLKLNFYSSARIGNEIGSRCFSKAFSEEFEKQKKVNSSKILNLLVVNVDATTAAINNLLLLSTSLISTFAIVGGLMYIDVKLSAILIVLIGIIYSIITLNAKNRLKRVGELVLETGIKRNSIIQETHGALRDIILSNAIPYVSNNYAANDNQSKLAGAQSLFLSSYPRQVLEFAGFSLIGFIALLNYEQKGLIVILGTFVLAIQRLLPNVQSIYMTWAGLRARSPAVREVVAFLDYASKVELLPRGSIVFESFELKDVSYSYPGQGKNLVLKNINLKIEKGDRIGIVGASGSGKSTLLDIIMLLILPLSGQILINGERLDKNNQRELRSRWMNSIGHVPQDIFLIDDTILTNIILDFGKSAKYNNNVKKRIVNSAKISQIHELIMSLPDKYESVVGERGSLLSGGQKQRLGIARAIFKTRGLLIFDEATSALDTKTEKNFISELTGYSNDYTLVMAAHRQETLKTCNKYFCVDNGTIKQIDSLEQYE